MLKLFARSVSAILLSSALLIFPTMIDFNRRASQQAQGNIQDDIDALLKAYDATLQNELARGTTQQIVDVSTGSVTRILTGESQLKMDQLWAETLTKINALQSRPAAERALTIEMLRRVAGADPVYVSRARTPYAPAAELEEYEAGKFVYHVDIRSGQIIRIRPKNQRVYSVQALYSENELANMARDYVVKAAPDIALDRLALEILNKDKEVYFFRWEETAGQLADGTRPFVQVALSRAGDFLNFENTLPFSKNFVAELLIASPVLAIGANEIYANGGTQWGWERLDAPYSTQNNAGYCYHAGLCSPKNFYYASSPSGNNTYYGSYHRGKWTATPYMRYRNTRTSAYIPCTKATAKVFYSKWYNGGSSSVEDYVDQGIWCNTWVEMSSTLYDIQRVVLANTNEAGSNNTIAWDEIWDYVP